MPDNETKNLAKLGDLLKFGSLPHLHNKIFLNKGGDYQ